MQQKRRKISPKHHLTHAVRQVVVPHKQNDFRPHLIRLPSLLSVVMAVFIFQMAYNFSQTGSVLGQVTDITARTLLENTNTVRDQDGKDALTLSTKLTQAATAKAEDMLENNYWSHVSPDGATPWSWLERSGYQYNHAGENLARDFHSTNGVITAWMNSSEHRKNVLDGRYEEVGFAVRSGILDGKPATVVVAMYGTPQDVPQVAGLATTAVTTSAASAQQSQSLISRIGVGLQSMTPAMVGSIFLLSIIAFVSLIAHTYRNQLPNSWRMSWKRHHGAYTALSSVAIVVVVLTLYGGGQI